MIRPATFDDTISIVRLGGMLIKSSAFKDTKISLNACINRIRQAIIDPYSWIGVAEHRGEIVGFLILQRVRYWWTRDEFYVLDDALFCERAGLGAQLVRAGVRWAFAQPNVREIILSFNSKRAIDRSIRTLARQGFREHGVNISIQFDREAKQWAA